MEESPPLDGESVTGVGTVTARTTAGKDEARATPEKTTNTDVSIKKNRIHTLQKDVKRT
jgi:hypothetical protein